MSQTPAWMILTCGTCGVERQVKYRKYGVRRDQDCHSCAGKKTNVAGWATTHGGHKTRLYTVWTGMKNRCNYSGNPGYRWYGGKGIRVCTEWANDFAAFRDWAQTHGHEDHLQLDRIDSSKDYSPQNCRWLTHRQNQMRISTVKLTPFDVAIIRKLLANKFRPFNIAPLYGVSSCAISNIKLGNTWKWVESA